MLEAPRDQAGHIFGEIMKRYVPFVQQVRVLAAHL